VSFALWTQKSLAKGAVRNFARIVAQKVVSGYSRSIDGHHTQFHNLLNFFVKLKTKRTLKLEESVHNSLQDANECLGPAWTRVSFPQRIEPRVWD
jgi:hypothetical protein